jgi:hypothetical protein
LKSWGKILGRGRGENKVAKKKMRSRLVKVEKMQRKKVNLRWHRDRKDNPMNAPSIHVVH